MIRVDLSARERRMVVMGVVTIGAMLTLTRGLPAWLAWIRDRRASAIELQVELARAQSGIQTMTAMRDSLSARRERLHRAGTRVLQGESPAAAVAALASLISERADSAAVRLGAVQLRPDTARSGLYARVALRADLTGDVRGVTTLLSALESGPTFLAIRELSISQPEPGANPDQPEMLRVEILVEGLAMLEGPGGSR